MTTPADAPGHISVLCIDEEQLLDRRHDAVSPKPAVHIATLDRILAHAREHELVYLPSHDVDAVARLTLRPSSQPS